MRADASILLVGAHLPLLAVPSDNQQAPQSLYGTVPEPFTFNFTDIEPTRYAGGSVKIADSRNFKVSQTIAAAEVTVEPGAMRELHVSISLVRLSTV